MCVLINSELVFCHNRILMLPHVFTQVAMKIVYAGVCNGFLSQNENNLCVIIFLYMSNDKFFILFISVITLSQIAWHTILAKQCALLCFPSSNLNIWRGKNKRLQRFPPHYFFLSSGPQWFRHTGRASFLALVNELFTHVNYIFSWRFLSTVFWPNPSALVSRLRAGQETRNASPRFLSFDLHEWTSDTFTFCLDAFVGVRAHSHAFVEWERK
jgi:hypothetical protein